MIFMGQPRSALPSEEKQTEKNEHLGKRRRVSGPAIKLYDSCSLAGVGVRNLVIHIRMHVYMGGGFSGHRWRR